MSGRAGLPRRFLYFSSLSETKFDTSVADGIANCIISPSEPQASSWIRTSIANDHQLNTSVLNGLSFSKANIIEKGGPIP